MRTGKLIGRMRAGVNRNGSLILAGGAIIGFGATVIFVARGQMKADEVIAERNRLYLTNPFTEEERADSEQTGEAEIVPKISKREYFDLTWRYYIPAAVSGVITLGCIVGSQYVSRRQMAGLMASVAALTANRDRIEEAIREKYGDEALAEIRRKLIPEKSQGAESGDICKKEYIQVAAEETGRGDLLCFEGYFGRWFRSSEEDVRRALEEISDDFKNGMYISYNDIYDALGIERSDIGYEFGWCNHNDYYDVEKGIQFIIGKEYDDEKGEDVLAFYIKDSRFLPMEGYLEI